MIKYKNISYIIISIIITCVFSTSRSEEIPCPSAANCERSLKEKLWRSYRDSGAVVTGFFKLPSPPDIHYISSMDKAFVEVVLSVKERLKGCVKCGDLRFKLPVNANDPSQKSPRHLIITNNYFETKAELESLENELENGHINLPTYLQRLQSLKQKLEGNVELLPQSAFLIPVSPGDTDRPDRIVDVPIRLDQKYLVFLLYQVQESQEKRKTLYPDSFDIYPIDGRIKYKEILKIIKSDKNPNPKPLWQRVGRAGERNPAR